MFSERLKELREKKNLTQKEFSKTICVSQSTIAMWETNKREPDFETAKKLAEYFGVSVDYLLGKTDFREQANNKKEYIEKEITTDEFLMRQGITDEEDIKNLKYLIGLMKKKNYNAELAEDFISKEYSEK